MSERPDLVILGCVATKRDEPAPARDLYISPLWEHRRTYAEASGARWLIFSALYGMVEPDRVIKPYDVTLKAAPTHLRQAFGLTAVAWLLEQVGSLQGKVVEIGREWCRPGVPVCTACASGVCALDL